MNLANAKVTQLLVPVDDFDRGVPFYRDTLGIPLLFAAPLQMAFFNCGGIRLLVGVMPAGQVAQRGSSVYFQVPDIHGVFAALKGKGVVFRAEPHVVNRTRNSELWLAEFADPDGNQLALMADVASDDSLSTENHAVVTHEEWLAARRALLEKEKAFTRAGEELSRRQRALPWERVTKDYVFDGANGHETLADLFAGRSQLIVYHFMIHPDDKAGCPHCSLRADGFDGIGVHLGRRDVTMVVVSRAPYARLAEYQKRMGWTVKWVSSGGSEFNYDYQASFTAEEMAARRALYNFTMRDPGAREREGHSIFFKDDSGAVFHTYSCYDRGNDKLNLHYHYRDLVPKGRDEGGRGPYWVRRRDEYGR